uniref:GH16 domain-containing protein n=1 Tax=Physcomitrium patens TaxID=3218 RepID=A0A2K1KC45_PHYPA|nr:hypothetical protein PHYPA_010542 [Physcomitrium patens]
MKIKLVLGDLAGTVTELLSAQPAHDELDFAVLGNISGNQYILQTNVVANGFSGREQQIDIWFDPTMKYRTYGIL